MTDIYNDQLNPATVWSEESYEPDVYRQDVDSDFRDQAPAEYPYPPDQWVDSVKVQAIVADDFEAFTVPVPSMANTTFQTQVWRVLQRVGNAERKRATIRRAGGNGELFITRHREIAGIVAMGGSNVISNGFWLSSDTSAQLVYESAADLYVVNVSQTTTDVAILSVIVEYYYPSQRPN